VLLAIVANISISTIILKPLVSNKDSSIASSQPLQYYQQTLQIPEKPHITMAMSRTEILGKVYKMVPPMLEKFHKGIEDHDCRLEVVC